MKGKTVAISGGSRGIGLAIALRFAKEGANLVIASKEEPSLLREASRQIEEAGGKALALCIDVREEKELKRVAEEAAARFGGIDLLVNNTSAAHFSGTLDTTTESFDLVFNTSARAAFFLSQACIPFLLRSSAPHIINISPPLNLDPHWFKDYLSFAMGKYAMSLCTLGMAAEFPQISVNSLWPQSTIATQTLKDHLDPKVYAGSRWPSIMGDAAYALYRKKCTGCFFTDEELLRETGMTDFSSYAVDPSVPLRQALFVSERGGVPIPKDLFLSFKQAVK